MKKIFIILILLPKASFLLAQNTDNKLKLEYLAVGFGGYYFKNPTPFWASSEDGGITTIVDLEFSYHKNLFSTSYLSGEELALWGHPVYRFKEISELYGRELKATNWLRFEAFTGLGYFIQNSRGYTQTNTTVGSGNSSSYWVTYAPTGNTVSVPIRINTKFYFTPHFGMGFTTNYSFNKINNVFSTNLVFHYKF